MAASGRTGNHGDARVTSQAEDSSGNPRAVSTARRCTFCRRKFESWPQGKANSWPRPQAIPNSQLSDDNHGLEALREACVWREPRNKLEEQLVAGWREEGGSGEQGGGDGGSQVSLSTFVLDLANTTAADL